MATERVAVRGLARMAGWMAVPWGALLALKGLYDAFFGEPEANFYAPKPWAFVTRDQWLRWAGFELAYGLACLALGFAAWEYAKRLPEFVVRDKDIRG
jgi:hypothetical protein